MMVFEKLNILESISETSNCATLRSNIPDLISLAIANIAMVLLGFETAISLMNEK